MRVNANTANTIYTQQSGRDFESVTLNTYYDGFCSNYNNQEYYLLNSDVNYNFTVLVSGLAAPAYLVVIGDLIFTTPYIAQATRWDQRSYSLQPLGQTRAVGQCVDCTAAESNLLGLNGQGNVAEYIITESSDSSSAGAPMLDAVYFPWNSGSGTAVWIDGATGALAGGNPANRLDGFDSGLLTLFPMLAPLN